MGIQDKAINIIELISQRLDPLFKSFDFHFKFRESESSVFSESLKYERDRIVFKISACLHPHDYPNTLNIQLVDKNFSPWKYINEEELFEMTQELCAEHRSDLLIATDIQVQSTIEELYEIMKCILKNIFSTELVPLPQYVKGH